MYVSIYYLNWAKAVFGSHESKNIINCFANGESQKLFGHLAWNSLACVYLQGIKLTCKAL